MAGLGRIALAALGILAYQNRDKLKELLSGNRQQETDPANPQSTHGEAGGSVLDQILGGTGLGELLDRFRNAGKGDAVDSWVKQGPNQPIESTHVAAAIDNETMEALVRQTGLTREEILERLAASLPDAVDEMTPGGRLPEAQTEAGNEKPTLLDPVPPVNLNWRPVQQR